LHAEDEELRRLIASLEGQVRSQTATIEQQAAMIVSLTGAVDRLTALLAAGAATPVPVQLPLAAPLLLRELADAYVKSVEFKKLRSKQTEEGRIRLHILRLLGDEPVMEVRGKIPGYRDTRATEVIDNKRKQKTTPATRNREVIRISAMCTWGVAEKMIPSHPLLGIAMEDENNERKTSPTRDDIYQLLFVARIRLKAMIATTFWGGFRKMEVCLLPLKQVQWDDGLIVLHADQTKTREGRVTIFPDMASKWVREYLDEREAEGIESPYLFCTSSGRPVSGRNVLRDYQDAWDRAGLVAADGERPWFHDLRAGFVGDQLELGTPEKVIMEMTGHSTHDAFDRYVRVRKRWIEDARRRAELAESQRMAPHGVVPNEKRSRDGSISS
jgi:site-specific recombinase XerD